MVPRTKSAIHNEIFKFSRSGPCGRGRPSLRWPTLRWPSLRFRGMLPYQIFIVFGHVLQRPSSKRLLLARLGRPFYTSDQWGGRGCRPRIQVILPIKR